MSSNYAVAVLIGRFQPFHNGHAALLAQALATAPKVCVVLGSAFGARNAKNPFTWQERMAMISATLDEATRSRITFIPMRDYYDDARWAQAVAAAVAAHTQASQRVALIGYVKDASSQYLSRFPDWDFVAQPLQGEIDATALRKIFFEGQEPAATDALLGELMPRQIVHYLKGWAHLPHFANLRQEHEALERYKKEWGSGPFITVDAVVKAGDQVLLIRRGRSPGKGLLAVPGGFLDGRERVLQGAIRELREETGFGLLDSVLEEALADVCVFDHPDRSQRGRTITHAHFFDLKHTRPPQVAGGDDAAEARWVAIADLAAMEDQFFEDHFNILNHFLAITG